MRETSPAYDEDQAAQLRQELEQIVMDWTGLRPDLAAPMANAILQGMRERLGGRRLYVPAPRTREAERAMREERDQQMLAMFTGANLAEVMRHFGVSRRTVYNALARAKEAKRKTVQPTA